MNRSDARQYRDELGSQATAWQMGYAKGRKDNRREWVALFAGFFMGRKVTLPALVFLTALIGGVCAIVVLFILHFFWWCVAAGVVWSAWRRRRWVLDRWRLWRNPDAF